MNDVKVGKRQLKKLYKTPNKPPTISRLSGKEEEAESSYAAKRGRIRQRRWPNKGGPWRRSRPVNHYPQLSLPPTLFQKMAPPISHHHHLHHLRAHRPHLRRSPSAHRPRLPNKPRSSTRHLGPPLLLPPPRGPGPIFPSLNRTTLHSPFYSTRHR